jgi:VWFA-related protein
VFGLSATIFCCLAPVFANSDSLILRGKVVFEGGGAPDKPVLLELVCTDHFAPGLGPTTDKKGEFIWRVAIDPMAPRLCMLRGSLKGYYSSEINISNLNQFSDPNLPPIVLGRKNVAMNQEGVPLTAAAPWRKAQVAMGAQNWAEAEQQLRLAVKAAPQFADAWRELGTVCESEKKFDDARAAYQRAIEANPNLLPAYLRLARLNLDAKNWAAATKAADGLLAIDGKHYPEACLHKAVALYELKDWDGAEKSIGFALALDVRHQLPRAEYVAGLILDARHDYVPARAHMANYLQLVPDAADAAKVRAEMDNLGSSESQAPASIAELLPESNASADPEAWVPGGMKALAAVAHIDGPYDASNFYRKYCQALVSEQSVGTSQGIPEYFTTLQAFLGAATELGPLGTVRGNSSSVSLSLASEDKRKQTEHILGLLGWRLVRRNDSIRVEPGDQPADGLRQEIPGLFGIDEIAMQEALEGGKEYSFNVPSENARLAEAGAWNDLLRDLPIPPGGFAAAFPADLKFARVCVGLGSMDAETARLFLSGIGLRTLITRYSISMVRHSGAFRVLHGGAIAPGGAEAEAAWTKLVGIPPRNGLAFFRVLLDKRDKLGQTGPLAAFYAAIARGDEAHQRYFTRTPARLERLYNWYRDSDEFANGANRQVEGWHTELLRDLPLDSSGNLRFPGGKRAWTVSPVSDDDVFFDLPALEALVPVAKVEAKRNAMLDEESARLLARHYTDWRPLFPYFEKMPRLGRAEFAALESFEDGLDKFQPATRNAVLAEWHSLLELIVRGTNSGALTADDAARFFGRICTLAAPDHATRAIAVLSEIAGTSDLDSAIPDKVLRLTGAKRSSFDRVLELQNIPRLGGAGQDAGKVAAALPGMVYAASVDADSLLMNEDPNFVGKHQFVPASPQAPRGRGAALFVPTGLVGSSTAPGSYVVGGFSGFDDLVRGFVPGGRAGPRMSPAAAVPAKVVSTDTGSGPLPETEVVFRASGRLVEVWATVTDNRGRHIDNLTGDQFTVLEQKTAQPLAAFEPQTSPVSVALLLDTTGSMQKALPALKNAALELIGDLRAEDSVAVYCFNNVVTELQGFTTDKGSAKRAVLRTQASGPTALYDALTRVGRDFSGRSGKKVIVVFTDGDDNMSLLTSDTAILRAKTAGVPVYTIAQGEALDRPDFLKQLAEVSKATGGEAFVIREPREIGAVFARVSEDLSHGYLLTFQPAPAEDHEWRTIEVQLKDSRGHKVRAREGFYPE